MNDFNVLSVIWLEKEKYISFMEKFKFGDDFLLFLKDVQLMMERLVRLCVDIKMYSNVI